MKQVFTADSETKYRTYNGWDSDYNYKAVVEGDFDQKQILSIRSAIKKFEDAVRAIIEKRAE